MEEESAGGGERGRLRKDEEIWRKSGEGRKRGRVREVGREGEGGR